MKKLTKNVLLIMFGFYAPMIVFIIWLAIILPNTLINLILMVGLVIVMVSIKTFLLIKYCKKEKSK